MNLELRSAVPADFAEIHALSVRAESHDRLPVARPLAEFEEWSSDPHLDMSRDTRVATEGGRTVAWARIWHRPSGKREERAYLFGAVDPASRGLGIGRVLLAWQIERAGELLRAASATLPRFIRAQVYDFQEGNIRLYRRLGMAAVRYGSEMLRPLDLPSEVVAASGVTITPWDRACDEDARIVMNDAFADLWGSTPRDRKTWQYELSAFGARVDLSFLAIEDGRVVGACRNGYYPDDEAITGRREGWIGQIGVERTHRGRGVASSLIEASLGAFRRAGLTHAALGVDSENPSGAKGLYERLGFRTAHRTIVHQREA